MKMYALITRIGAIYYKMEVAMQFKSLLIVVFLICLFTVPSSARINITTQADLTILDEVIEWGPGSDDFDDADIHVYGIVNIGSQVGGGGLLTILAGTTVSFHDDGSINIHSSVADGDNSGLKIAGTSDDRVILEPADGEDFYGIKINPLRFQPDPEDEQHTPQPYADIEFCTIKESSGDGIYCCNGSLHFKPSVTVL